MQEALNNIIKAKDRFNNLSINSKVSKSNLNIIDVQSFLDLLSTFADLIDPTKNHEKFIKNNLNNIKELKNILIGDDFKIYEKYYNTELSKRLKKVYNIIVNRLNYNNIIGNKETYVTKIFTEFLAGITYFKKELQELRWPIYHRDASCGSKRRQTIYTFRKTLFGPNMGHKLERCYIERMVYDQIYRYIVGIQDFGHRFELQTLERFYLEYFPNKYMKIEVKFIGEIPNKLIISYLDSVSNRIIEKYEYKRTIIDNNYDNTIICYKKILEKEYMKEQTFELESEWKAI
jgi:hypothetical protein